MHGSSKVSTSAAESTVVYSSGKRIRDPHTGQVRTISTVVDDMIYARPSDRELREGLRSPRYSLMSAPTLLDMPVASTGIGSRLKNWFSKFMNVHGTLVEVAEKTTEAVSSPDHPVKKLASVRVASKFLKLVPKLSRVTPFLSAAMVYKDVVEVARSEQPKWKKSVKGSLLVFGTVAYYFIPGHVGLGILLVSLIAPMILDKIKKDVPA